MTAHLVDTLDTAERDPIEELAVIRLVRDVTVEHGAHVPKGSLGAVVFVHNGGEAFEVEFTEPVAALVTLRRADIEPTETTRASVASAVGVHHRRR